MTLRASWPVKIALGLAASCGVFTMGTMDSEACGIRYKKPGSSNYVQIVNREVSFPASDKAADIVARNNYSKCGKEAAQYKKRHPDYIVEYIQSCTTKNGQKVRKKPYCGYNSVVP